MVAALARAGDPVLLEVAPLLLLVGLGSGATGSIFLVSAWRRHVQAREQRERWVRAGAVVVGYKVAGARRVHYPILQFTLPDGQTVEAQAQAGANLRTHAEGEVVALYYDPSQPHQVRLEHWLQDAVPTIHGFLGAIAAGVGCVTLLMGLLLVVLGLRA